MFKIFLVVEGCLVDIAELLQVDLLNIQMFSNINVWMFSMTYHVVLSIFEVV